MRRTVMFVAVAVLAVWALPGLGIGQSETIHGSSPVEVFATQSTGAEACASRIGVGGKTAMATSVSIMEQSHLLAYFTGQWDQLEGREEGLFAFDLADEAGNSLEGLPFEWTITGAGRAGSTTLMWTFDNVPTGEYLVRAAFRTGGRNVDRPRSSVSRCVLTVFVEPVA